MTPQQKVQSWKELINYLKMVQDPILRKALYCEYQARAQQYWGFCPGKIIETGEPELNDWEKEFLEDIKISEECGMNIRKEKQVEEARRAHINMYEFVCAGNDYNDLPKSLQSENLHKLYIQCLCEAIDQTIKEIDLTSK